MTYISTFLAAIICATAPLSGETPNEQRTETASSNFTLGRDTVAAVRASYENGKFNQFMFDMDEAYRKADLKDFYQQREEASQFAAESEEKYAKYKERLITLHQQKKNELLEALPKEDTSSFATKVRSLTADILTQEQQAAVERIHALISKAPNRGANVDENTLIDIDLEYEFKLNYALAKDLQNTKEGSLNSETQKKQLALRMEKMDKMLHASKHFEDKSLKAAVQIAHATLDARLARNLDGADLNALSKQKSPNGQEEVVYSILRSYQGQFSDLIHELQ